ncbi:MAG: CvpA family protein [Patescibacteria group bacterium]
MIFTLIDVILVVVVVVFAVIGLMMGLIEAIGALIGVIAGAWLASNYFLNVADWLTPILLGHSGAAKIIAFLVIFIIVNRLVGLIFWLLSRFLKLLSIIPFLKSINKIGGFILGLGEGVLATGLMVYVIVKFLPDQSALLAGFNGSRVAHLLVWATQFLTNLMP